MSPSEPVEVWRGGVNAWECDEMGHLNVRFHVARAMQGLAGVAAALGMPHAFAGHASATLLVREHHIRFLREARTGAPLVMTAGVAAIDEAEAAFVQILRHALSGEIAATFVTRAVHASARDGRPFPWPERARRAAETLKCEIPPEAGPRTLTDDAPDEPPSGDRADALGLAPISRAVIGAEHVDVFGRMRTELFMGLISDGVLMALDPIRGEARRAVGDGVRVGAAAVEYRLRYFDHPRTGDHVLARSGPISMGAKASRLRHWLLDPTTGAAWAAAEHVSLSFDLDSRKAITLPEDAVARLRSLSSGSGRSPPG